MRIFFYLLLSFFFFSCQEEITLDLANSQEKIVVEGSIEPGFPPYVIITRSQGYFDPINENTYSQIFVDNIDSVKVWFYENDSIIERNLFPFTISDTLPEIYTDLSFFNNPSYDFSRNGTTYYLAIYWENQIISSETRIPESTPLDCLWVEKSTSFEDEEEKDYKFDIRAVYSDPAGQQNNILIKSKRLEHYVRKGDHSEFTQCVAVNKADNFLKLVDAGSDVLIDGQSFETQFPRPKDDGFPTGKYNGTRYIECNDSTVEFKRDVVLIKFCQIDEPSMKFWRSLVRQFGTNGNPFSEPMNLVSNINNGLGSWTGYAPSYYRVPIVEDIVIKNEYDSLIITDIL